MAAKSTSTSTPKARSRRKTKQATQSPAIHLTHEMIKEREKEQAYKEWHYFLANRTEGICQLLPKRRTLQSKLTKFLIYLVVTTLLVKLD